MKPRLLVPLFLTILLIALGAIASACGGGNDSDGATDGNADDRSGEGDGSSSSSSGSSVPLYSSDVYDFTKGAVIGSAGQLEAANRELDRVVESGQRVIKCQYGPTNTEAQTGYPVYGFWYEDVPDNIDELLLVAGDYGVPEYVSRMGTNAISSCPDSRDEGKALWLEDYRGLSADGGGGAVTLHFENIQTRLPGGNYCGGNTGISCVAVYELDVVFEASGDVGADITLSQVCHIWNDGKLFGNVAFGTGCRDPSEHEYRIDPHGEFRTRVSGDNLAADIGVVYKYTGRDDEGNVIYLERALSTHETISGLEIVERNEYWLADRPYKEWRSNNVGPADER